MSESKLYKDFKKNWKNYIQRVETDSIGNGFPDCHLVNDNGSDIFVELKYIPKKFKNKKLKIRNSQIIWHYSYPGKNSFILFQVDKKYFVFKSNSIKTISKKIKYEDFEKESLIETENINEITDFLNNLL